jgi:HK97 family phage portal protein
MGFVGHALERRGYRLEMFSPMSTAYWVAKLFGGGYESAAGVSVTPDTALTISVVYSSIRNIAEDLAKLPLPVYRDNVVSAGGSAPAALSGRKIVDRTVPAYALLNDQANPEMDAMAFRETIFGHELLRGDGFAEIERDQGLRAKALWPLNPARMRMVRNGKNGVNIPDAPPGQLAYLYQLPGGTDKIFAPEMIFHLHGFGPDGLRGYSIVAMLRDAMGLALATEQYGGRFFRNDASPGAVLTHPKTLSDKARTNIEHSWKEAHQGLDNAHRIAILEEGLTVTKVGIDPQDAQFLETRKFQRDELAMWLRMPPDKLGTWDKATYSNMEQSAINYVRDTLGAHAVRFERTLRSSGVVDAQHYALHDFTELLRSDSAGRVAYYHGLRQDGAISGEDIRRMENFDPSGQAGADELLVPMNMLPASAFLPNGLTYAQAALAAYNMLRAGYEADSVNVWLGLGDLKHTGIVPGKTTEVPSEASDAADAADAGPAPADTGTASDTARSNGHRPGVPIPAEVLA